MSKPITDIDDPRLVKALAHPLRIKIIGLLEQRSATPKEMALALDVPLENLSYHVRALRDFGFIKLDRKRIVRGAVEHRYSLASRPRITADAWDKLPDVVREALTAGSLEQIWSVVAEAAAQGKMERPECQIARHRLRYDEEAFLEASQIMSETYARLQQLEKEAAKRLRRHDAVEVPAICINMLFDAPDPVEALPKKRRARSTTSSKSSNGKQP